MDDKKEEIARLEQNMQDENKIINEINEVIVMADTTTHDFKTITTISDCLTDIRIKTATATVDTYDEEMDLLNIELFKHQNQLAADTARINQLQDEIDNFGACVIEYAKQFEGNRYVWGGTSLENGIDCSGFVMRVYEEFGYDLPHSSAAQRSVGHEVEVDDIQLGDIVCYNGHVGLYAGDGQIINASNSAPYPRGGIKYSDVNYSRILTVRRLQE